MNIFIREIKANLKSLFFWSVGMLFTIVSSISKFTGIGKGGQSSKELFQDMPKSIQALFGFSGVDVTTITGLYAVLFVYILLLASIHAATLAAGIISKEERDRTFEFLYVRPVRRTEIIAAKLLAVLTNLLILNLVALVASILITPIVAKQNISLDILRLMTGMLIVQLVFAAIGVLLSLVLKNSKSASGIASCVVLVAYLLSVAADLNEKLDFFRYLTPFKYFGAATILETGFNWVYILVSASIIIVSLFISRDLHSKRDLMV